MGSVIYLRSLLKAAGKYLDYNKLLITGIDLDLQKISPSSHINIKNKTFYFKKVIIYIKKIFLILKK